MTVRNPRDENGPDGYPLNNVAFRDAANKVLKARQEDACQARRFLEKLGSSLHETSTNNKRNGDGSFIERFECALDSYGEACARNNEYDNREAIVRTRENVVRLVRELLR